LLLVPFVKTTIRPAIEPTAKIIAQILGLNIPAMAEHPATKIRRQDRINST
jgi:hypothetical protein